MQEVSDSARRDALNIQKIRSHYFFCYSDLILPLFYFAFDIDHVN